MTRWLLAWALLAGLVVGAVLTVEPRSDAASIFGAERSGADLLDTVEGRGLTIAIVSPDRAARNQVALEIAEALRNDPMIADVAAGPAAPSAEVLDWLWQHRFRLTPPGAEDLTPDAMAARLLDAQAALTRAEGLVIAPYLLRDPTGSFQRLLSKLSSPGQGVQQSGGVWQARDGSAALIFARLADRPYDIAATGDLTVRIRGMAAQSDLRAIVIGPRAVAADISRQTERAAVWASGLAGALLLGWLCLVLRRPQAVLVCLLPLAIGFAAAALTVQLAFSSVHVLALGFGGALMGLAIDYPLHLLSHPREVRQRARRLVLLGAGTTAIAFLSLTGAGLPAFAEIGVFVATGLLSAALTTRLLLSDTVAPVRPLRFERLLWHLPYKPLLAAILAGLGISLVVTFETGDDRLVALPGAVEDDLHALRSMLTLPSGRYRLTVEGASAEEVLQRQRALLPVLDQMRVDEVIGGFQMLGQVLAPVSQQQDLALPDRGTFVAIAEQALRNADMAPDFAEALGADYLAAIQAPVVVPDDLRQLGVTRGLAARLGPGGAGWIEAVALYDTALPDKLANYLAEASVPGVSFLDTRQSLSSDLAELKARVLQWLAIGAVLAFGFLALVSARPRDSIAIALSCAGALGLTMLVLLIATGPLGVFQIMALILVVGIGVDYGIFLTLGGEERVDAARSCGLCAVSTLLAFGVMAFSSAPVLAEIGLTVSLGVIAMLGLHLAHPRLGSVPR
ncbi:MAG: MMPL family transporter [Pseudomonadota bacterium]